MIKEQLDKIKEEALQKIAKVNNLDMLNDLKVAYLGKKGELTAVLKGMKDVLPEDKPKVGQMVNEVRQMLEEKLAQTKDELVKIAREEQMKMETIDVTLPAKKNVLGHSHPNTVALNEVERIFTSMGYEVVDGPEIEYDENTNFSSASQNDGKGKIANPHDFSRSSFPF